MNSERNAFQGRLPSRELKRLAKWILGAAAVFLTLLTVILLTGFHYANNDFVASHNTALCKTVDGTDRKIVSTTWLVYVRGRCIRISNDYVEYVSDSGNIDDGILLTAIWPSMEAFFTGGGALGKSLRPGESTISISAQLASKAPPLEHTLEVRQEDYRAWDSTDTSNGLKQFIITSKRRMNKELFAKYENNSLISVMSCDKGTQFIVNPQCEQFIMLDGMEMNIRFSRYLFELFPNIDAAVLGLYRRLTAG